MKNAETNINQNNLSETIKGKFKKLWKFDLNGDFYRDLSKS